MMSKESEVNLNEVKTASEINEDKKTITVTIIMTEEEEAELIVKTADNLMTQRKYGIKNTRVLTKELSLPDSAKGANQMMISIAIMMTMLVTINI